MISNIKAVHDDAYNCIEDSVIAIVAWKNLNYELMFSEYWGFDFKPTSNQAIANLGDRIDTCTGNILDITVKYTGIKYNLVQFTSIETDLPLIEKELLQNRPIYIYVDSFWVPWSQSYQSNHVNHVCLVTGIDDNNLYLTDPYYLLTHQPLSIEECGKLIKSYATFDFQANNTPNLHWKEIIKKTIVKLNTCNYYPNSFCAMRAFAEYINNITDINKEIPGLRDDIWHTEFWYRLDAIRRGRRKYIKLLNSLSEKYNEANLMTASKLMEHIATSWSVIMSLFYKMSFMEDPSIYLKRISSKINKVSVEEEELCNYLIKVIEGNVQDDKMPDVKFPSKINQILNVDFIDLSNYYTNNAVSHIFSNESNADLTGTGQYFLASELPDDSIWKVEDMSFNFPTIIEDQNDNVTCQSQTIPLTYGIYSTIMVLGCGEWGNFSENMILHFEDGESQSIELEFTDWHFSPIYGESIAWVGKNVDKNKETAWFNNLPAHIFAKSYDVNYQKKIVSITLPDCPNIHIFAISMGK